MSEVVSKEEYWQIILNDPSKVGQITTEDEKFNKIADFVYIVVQSTLLASEDEDYLKKYEEMIDISGEGLTPYQRKVNILYMLSGKNYIPLNLVRRGLINMGVSAFDIELLKDENKLVVHTDRADDTQFKRVTALLESVLPENLNIEQYNHNMEISWRDINKYAECTTVAEMCAVNPDYKNDLTSEGEWVYPVPELVNGHEAFSVIGNLKRIIVRGDNITTAESMIRRCKKLESIDLYLPKATNISGMNLQDTSGSLIEVRGFAPLAKNGYRAFKGRTRLVEMDFPSLSGGSLMFDECQLTKNSSLRILNRIPAYTSGTHELTIGIHVDHKTDTEVLAAIANAEAKGWTLAVQWNGTPTTQASVTYGLRKPPIYAKVGGVEHPDGTIEQTLDWGHYVTNPEDYQEFSSLDCRPVPCAHSYSCWHNGNDVPSC